MERLEKLGREAKYDGMVKPPCASAVAAGKRKPAYINYTQNGRFKGCTGSRHGGQERRGERRI